MLLHLLLPSPFFPWSGLSTSNLGFHYMPIQGSSSVFYLFILLLCCEYLKGLTHFCLSVICGKVKLLSLVRLFATLWTVAYQAPPSMKFSRQEFWSGLPFPSPGDLPDPEIEPRPPPLEADTLTSEPPGKPNQVILYNLFNLAVSFF